MSYCDAALQNSFLSFVNHLGQLIFLDELGLTAALVFSFSSVPSFFWFICYIFKIIQNLLILWWIHDLSSTPFALSNHMRRSPFLVSAWTKVAQRKFLFVVSVNFKSIRVTIPSLLSTLSNNWKAPQKIYRQLKELHICPPSGNSSLTR